MIILGLNYIGHDAAAALFIDGQLVAAIEEERFTRDQKHLGAFPHRSIHYCLKAAGIAASSIDHIGFYLEPRELLQAAVWRFGFTPPFAVGNKFMPASRFYHYLHCKTLRARLCRHLPSLRKGCQIHFVRHHDAHMASAFFASPFEIADVLSIDGMGEWETTVAGSGTASSIKPLASVPFPHSLGYLYAAITRHLGFSVNNDEYKVMGLASYGDPSRWLPLMRRIVMLGDGIDFRLDTSYLSFKLKWGYVSRRFAVESGLAERTPDAELTQAHKDMAAAVQTITEEAGVHLARVLQDRTGGQNLCLSGGVALNCVMAARMLTDAGYDDIYTQPAAYDASGALGSALWIQHVLLGRPRSFAMNHAYWGHCVTDEEIDRALASYRDQLRWTRPDNIARAAAGEIRKKRIVGWCQGRLEWGPRALGNRSILADPTDRAMMDHVNDKVKHREDFRPFAPSCKAEACGEYFDLPVKSPFMTLISGVRPMMQQKIPAVTHVDGTARYHSVEREVNPLFWKLIDEFEKLSGVPVVLNTSFNVRGEPIVMTADDAIACFLGTGIDVLAIGNYLVEKITKEV